MIGGLDVGVADLKVDDPNIKFRRKFIKPKKGQLDLTNFLNTGDKSLNAIVLVYNKDGKPLQDFELTENKKFITLNENLLNIIQENLVDMVVYTRRGEFFRCNMYETIAPKLKGRQYALRELDLSTEGKDLTLSRCSVTSDAVCPEGFKISEQTPGEENDCTGPHFIMENYASELFMAVPNVSNTPTKFIEL